MKIGFISLGCSKNLVDSERIMGMLRQGGHEFVADPKEAEAILIKTACIDQIAFGGLDFFNGITSRR